MKTKLTITAIATAYFVAICTLGALASVPGNTEKSARESVRREIIRNIGCPDFVTSNNADNEVKAVVKVDEAGTVAIEDINSTSPQLQAYVVNQLHNMKVHNQAGAEKFVLVIKFRVD